ncbi:MAG TPA: malectin domain-containing carbohydrate-binding protein [Actinomycetes bacterium]
MVQKSLAYGIRFALLVLCASLVPFTTTLNAPAKAAAATTVRVNNGGAAFTESNRIAWTADHGYDGGRISSTSSKIAGTTNSRLYQSYRVSLHGYALPVTSGQRYRVRVFLTETYFTARGKRVFDIRAEGNLVANNVDIYAAAGYKRAYSRSFEVAVNDGVLNLDFSAEANVPVVSGIEAVPVGAIDGTAPAGGTGGAAKLAWAPPHLDSPTIVNVSASNHVLHLDPARDYLIRMPATKLSVLGGLVIVGGHDVVLVGGAITIPGWGASHPTDNRGLYLKEQTGTVHVEGLLIDDSGGALSEGINVNAPKATVQLENIRVEDIHATDEVRYTDNHPDIVQAWGGAAALRIDRLSGTTDYQGITPDADWNTLGQVDLRNVNVASGSKYEPARYLFWTDPADTGNVTLDNVWLKPGKNSLANTVWPDVDAAGTSKAMVDDTSSTVSWPAGSFIHGTINGGTPSTGDFVPAGTVGTGYASPGYAG